jgi:cell division protein FtsB
MPLRARFEFPLRIRWQHWLLAVGIGLAAYFGYHALNGSRGLLAWRQLSVELAGSEHDLAALRAERVQLERRVDRLRSNGLDADLIDELARRSLSLAEPLDMIILLDQERAPR